MDNLTGITARLGALWRVGRDHAVRMSERVVEEARQIVDLKAWHASASWPERLQSISWPRVGAFGGSGVGLVGLAWIALAVILAPRGLQAYPPPLPTKVQMQAAQDATRALQSRSWGAPDETRREPSQ